MTRRLSEHRGGYGARIMAAVREAGIGWSLVRCWPGGRSLERQLKARHRVAPLCPSCNPRCRRNRSRRRFRYAPEAARANS